jgi:hypothetical protein
MVRARAVALVVAVAVAVEKKGGKGGNVIGHGIVVGNISC